MSGPAVFRISPVGPASAYRSYEILRPRATHTRAATCEEVDCRPHRWGWTTRVPAGSDLERLLRSSGRAWSGRTAEAGGVVAYLFGPGTECFRSHEHRLPVMRPSIYRVRDGDWRGNPSGFLRMHARPEDWAEDFAQHTDTIATAVRRG